MGQNQSIKSVNNPSMCLDVPGGSKSAVHPIQSWPCNNTDAQSWAMINDTIINKGSGMCLDVKGNSRQPGTPVGQWPCNNTAAQKWVYNQAKKSISLKDTSDKCIDLSGGQAKQGTPLILWGCHGGTNQQWTLEPRVQENAQDMGKLVANIANQTREANKKWQCVDAWDITVPVSLNDQGDVQCLSTNAKDCIVRPNQAQCKDLLANPPRESITPLVCGSTHAKIWGGTGYDDAAHWCSKGKSLLSTIPPNTAPVAQPAPDTVIFYEHCNYGGKSVAHGVGNYGMNDMGMANDSLSAVRVPPGYQVTLYERAGFGGKRLTLTKDAPCLVDQGWNDLTSSFKIQKTSEQTDTSGKKTNWQCLANITVPVSKVDDGNIQCMSSNAKECLWQSDQANCQKLLTNPPTPLLPVVCGDKHKSFYSITGYENPAHWCAQAKKLIDAQPVPQPVAEKPTEPPVLAPKELIIKGDKIYLNTKQVIMDQSHFGTQCVVAGTQAGTVPGAKPGVVAPGAKPGVVVPGAKPGVVAPGAKPGVVVPGAKPGVVVPGAKPGVVVPGAKPVITGTDSTPPVGGYKPGDMIQTANSVVCIIDGKGQVVDPSGKVIGKVSNNKIIDASGRETSVEKWVRRDTKPATCKQPWVPGQQFHYGDGTLLGISQDDCKIVDSNGNLIGILDSDAGTLTNSAGQPIGQLMFSPDAPGQSFIVDLTGKAIGVVPGGQPGVVPGGQPGVVKLTHADSGKNITVAPGTIIDIQLSDKPGYTGFQWSPVNAAPINGMYQVGGAGPETGITDFKYQITRPGTVKLDYKSGSNISDTFNINVSTTTQPTTVPGGQPGTGVPGAQPGITPKTGTKLDTPQPGAPLPGVSTKNWSGYEYTADGRCGPQFGNKSCQNKKCCSKLGWCGGVKGEKDDWCGAQHGFDGKFDAENPNVATAAEEVQERDYLYHSGWDSYGNDITRVTTLQNNVPALKQRCDKTPKCVAFNTNGWLKHALLPENEWMNWTTDPKKGMYVVKPSVCQAQPKPMPKKTDKICPTCPSMKESVVELVVKPPTTPDGLPHVALMGERGVNGTFGAPNAPSASEADNAPGAAGSRKVSGPGFRQSDNERGSSIGQSFNWSSSGSSRTGQPGAQGAQGAQGKSAINWSASVENGSNSGGYMFYLIRLVFLFGLVFFFASVVPTEPLDMRVRGTIALIVVVIYSLITAIKTFLSDSKNYVCANVCPKKK